LGGMKKRTDPAQTPEPQQKQTEDTRLIEKSWVEGKKRDESGRRARGMAERQEEQEDKHHLDLQKVIKIRKRGDCFPGTAKETRSTIAASELRNFNGRKKIIESARCGSKTSVRGRCHRKRGEQEEKREKGRQA